MNDESNAVSAAAGERPNRTHFRRGFDAVAVLLLLSACAQQPTPAPAAETLAIEQRLLNLERRFESLERYITNLPSPPLRSRDEIERNIQSLEARRTALLERYTSAHPLVREVDLSLRLLRLQLEITDQANRTGR